MSNHEEKPAAEAPEAARLNLGVRLKAAREARGLSEQDVAQRLRLDLHIVRALESDDLDRLPALTFVRGYLRNYARLVGLDEALVREALPDTGEAVAKIDLKRATMGGAVSTPGLPWMRWLRNLVLLAMVAGVLVLVVPHLLQVWEAWQQRPMEAGGEGTELALPGISPEAQPDTGLALPPRQDEEGPPSPEAAVPESQEPALEELLAPVEEAPAVVEPSPAEQPPVAEEPVQERAASSGQSLVLTFEEDSWVEIEDRDSRLLFGLMTAGTRRVLEGEPPFQVLLGNAPGVQVRYRGEAFDTAPHRRGKVARFRLE